MSGRLVSRPKALMLVVSMFLVLPMALGTVTIGENTLIEQADNDVEIVAEEDFNVSELNVFDEATQFGTTNFSLIHTNEDIIHANMTEFTSDAGEGEALTSFRANGSSGEELDIQFSNLTRRMFYQIYIDGLGTFEESSGDEGDFSYSLSYDSDEFRDFELRAETQDFFEHQTNFPGDLTYGPDNSIQVDGSGQYQISEDDVDGGEVELILNDEIKETTSTDSDGEYSFDIFTPKEAGNHLFEVNMSQHHLYDSESREVTVDSLFLENSSVESLETDGQFIDIDEDGALNISTVAFRNLDGEIEQVDYLIFDSEGAPVQSTFEPWAQLENTTDRTETGIWFNETPSLSNKEGIGLGNYTIELDAQSTLDGQTINVREEDRPEFEVKIQDLDTGLEIDQQSYSVNNDDFVNITGQLIRQPDEDLINDTEVDINIYDNETGDGFNVEQITTNETGHFELDYEFAEEEGVRRLEVVAEDENGITGNDSEVFTVTELTVENIMYEDSEENHSYNISSLVSDSRGITNHECSLSVSDLDGNQVDYDMDVDAEHGAEDEALCETPYVSWENNSEWDPTEELEATVEVENGSAFAADTATRSLPNTPPTVTEFDINEIEKQYAADIEAIAEDPNKDEDEIVECNVYYYNNDEEYVVDGNLDTSHGEVDEAKCTFSIDSTLEGIGTNENVTTQVEFVDQQGATDISDNKTAELAADLNFEAELRTFVGGSPGGTIEFYEPGTDNVVNTIEGNDSTLTGTVARGTYDMNVKTLDSEVQFNDAEIDDDTSFLLEMAPNVSDRYDDEVSADWARTSTHIAVDDIDVQYNDATIRFDYSSLEERYVTPWECDEWNEDPTYRDCRENDFPRDSLDYEPAEDYNIDSEEQTVSLNTDVSEGAYVLASNRGWLQDWFDRQEITVEGRSEEVENYQVKFTVDTREEILDNNLDEECSSIRFYNTDQTEELNHWMEPGTCNSEETVFWVEIPFIPADAQRTIFMYYSDEQDEITSSGEETFIQFDEFDEDLTGYDESGRVNIEDDRAVLESSDSEEASLTYTESDIEKPYRLHSVARTDETSDESSISTYIDGDDSISYELINNIFSESFSGEQTSEAISTEDWIRLNQSVTGEVQRATTNPEDSELEINGSLPKDEVRPFEASVVGSEDTFSSLEVERWFTTKYVEPEPVVVDKESDRLWDLTFNGTSRGVNVPFNSTMDIELNSSDYSSKVELFISDNEGNDQLVLDSEGEGVEGILFRDNLDENRTYQVTGEVLDFDESITRDITVGQNNESPTVELLEEERVDTNEMNFTYQVKDNYQGPVECSLAIDGEVKDRNRVNLDLDFTFYEDYFYTTDAPHGENDYNISCTDNSDNTGNFTGTYVEDFKAPEIEFTEFEDGQTVWQTQPRVDFRFEDDFNEDVDYTLFYGYDESMNVTGTLSNATEETRILPESEQFGVIDLVIVATDDQNQTRTESVSIDLNEPFVNLTRPEEGNEEERTIHNPDLSDNTEVLPETRYQTDTNDTTYEFEYTNDQLTTAQCRVVVEGEVKESGEFPTNEKNEMTIVFEEEDYNMDTRVECETEVGTFVSGETGERTVDYDETKPELDLLTFEQSNETEYELDQEHSITAVISDNLMTPATSDTVTDTGPRNSRCSVSTETDPAPFLEIEGEDNQIAMQHNFDGDSKNETFDMEMQSFVWDCRPITSIGNPEAKTRNEPSDEVTANFGELAAGQYEFQMWISDEINNTKETETFIYEVQQGDPSMSISSDNERIGNNEIVRDTSPEIRCSGITDQVSTTLERNGLEIDSSEDATDRLTDNQELPTGTYDYECYTEGDENFTADSSTRTIEVVDEVEDEIYITANGSEGNNTFTFGETVELDISSRSEELGDEGASSELYFEGEEIVTPTVDSYEVGTYELFGNSTGSYRFIESNETRFLEIERADNDVELDSNFTISSTNIGNTPLCSGPYCDSSVNVLNTVRGQFPEIQCTSETESSRTEVTRDGDVVHTGTGNTTHVINTPEVDDGFYRYNCETNTTENYNSASTGIYVDIEDSPPPTQLIEPPEDDPKGEPVEAGFDFTEEEIEVNLERGKTVDVTCDTEENVPATLFYEGEEVGNNDVQTFDETGFYNHTCITEETEDFRATQKTIIWDVMNKTSTELEINGSNDDLTVDQEEVIEIVGDVNVSDTVIELRDNRTEEERFWTDDDGLAEINHSFMIPGKHEITAFKPEEDDYFQSEDSSIVTVNDVTPPEIEIVSPEDGEIWEHNDGSEFGIFSSNDYEIRYRTRDYSEHTCDVEVNGSSVGSSSFGINDDFEFRDVTQVDNKESGVYDLQILCEDEHGNRASTDTIEFRLNSEDPEIEFNEDQLVETGDPSPELNVSTDDVSSREATIEIFTNASVETPDEGSPFLTGGNKVADTTRDLGTHLIETDQISPGLYSMSARVTDEVGRTDYVHDAFDLRVFDNVTFMHPEDSGEDEITYVNTNEPELSFKYYSEEAPLTCDVRLNGNLKQTFTDIEEDTWVNNSITEFSNPESELEEGEHSWSVECGTEKDSFIYESDFVVDTTAPEIVATNVNRPSGHSFTGQPLRFDATVVDNNEVDEVNITAASNPSKEQTMFCSDNQCTAELDLEPGEWEYNYTACDKAGNCETTQVTNYEILDESNSMNLFVNDQDENITITEDPIVNLTGEFVSPKEGTVFFYVNDSLEARCERGDGCTVEQNFLRPNGTYRIDAEFFSTSDFTTNQETLWVNAQVPEDAFDGFIFRNLPEGKNASLRSNPGLSVMANPVQDNRDVMLGNGVGEDLAAQLNIQFDRDIDGSDINFDTNRSARKSYLHLESDYPRVLRKDLLVPRIENTGEVTVCPGATSLEEVEFGCEDGYNISTGEEVGPTTMEEVTINGQQYYEVRGITGTGGQEVPSETDEDSPAEANVEQIDILEEYQQGAPSTSDLEVEGGNITRANLTTTQATDNWAGIYGNATGDLVLGTEAIFFQWDAVPQLVIAANHTVEWDNLQSATVENVDRYYGMQDLSDSAENTLTNTEEFEIGDTQIENAPSIQTYNGTRQPLWITGALSDGEEPLFAGEALDNDSTAFTGEIANYQMMVPTGGDEQLIPYSMYMTVE